MRGPSTADASRSRRTRTSGRKTDVELRRRPVQARGQATFERILDVTAQLLDEHGVEALTTNHIAKAVGINVATLYQYFPNKQAVLLSLFKRQTAHRSGSAERLLADLDGARGWRRVVHAAIDAAVDLRRTTRGVLPLRQAMRSNPQLLEYDRQDTILTAAVLASKLVEIGGVGRAEAELVARCAMEMISAILDMWLIESGGRDGRVVRQVKALVEGYLAPYLDRGRPPRRARPPKRR